MPSNDTTPGNDNDYRIKSKVQDDWHEYWAEWYDDEYRPSNYRRKDERWHFLDHLRSVPVDEDF